MICSYAIFENGRYIGVVDAQSDQVAKQQAQKLFESNVLKVEKI